MLLFLSHECSDAHVLCVSSLTGKAMLQMSEHAGAMLIFSSRKLVTLLDSSVGRLDHPQYNIYIYGKFEYVII